MSMLFTNHPTMFLILHTMLMTMIMKIMENYIGSDVAEAGTIIDEDISLEGGGGID